MLGRPYNLITRHMLYRRFPHRQRTPVPRNIATDTYDRELVLAQIRKEIQCTRNVDMFTLLARHVIRLHSRTATSASSTKDFIIVSQHATRTVARTAASPRSPHRKRTSKPLIADLIRSGLPLQTIIATASHSISLPSRTPSPSSSPSPMSCRPSPPTKSIQSVQDFSSTACRSPQPTSSIFACPSAASAPS